MTKAAEMAALARLIEVAAAAEVAQWTKVEAGEEEDYSLYAKI
jgi:hypothetical protein